MLSSDNIGHHVPTKITSQISEFGSIKHVHLISKNYHQVKKYYTFSQLPQNGISHHGNFITIKKHCRSQKIS